MTKLNKIKKTTLVAILSVFIVVETFIFSVANATLVNNWPSLADLLYNRFAGAIIDTFKSQINSYMQHILNRTHIPGILYDFSVSDYSKTLESLYQKAYLDVFNKVKSSIPTGKDWINNVKKGKVVPPVVTGQSVSGDFADYVGYVSGDMKVVYEMLNRVLSDSEIDEITKTHLKMRARELDIAKASLSQKIIETAATASLANKFYQDLTNLYAKIDNSMRNGNYQKEQAMKDLIKIQAYNTQLMNELIRKSINNQFANIAVINSQLNEEKNELLKELLTLQVKTEGTWTWSTKPK